MRAKFPHEPEPDAAIRLIPAHVADAERIAELSLDIWRRYYSPDILSPEEIAHLWQRSYRPEALRRDMASGAVYRWIERAGEAIGFLAYRHHPEERRLWLLKLYLEPKFHGLGLGAHALESVKRAAVELGVREISLYVFKKNRRAIRAYLRAGFVIAREELCPAGEGYHYDDYVMSYRFAEGPPNDIVGLQVGS